jgi:hypothetical protein
LIIFPAIVVFATVSIFNYFVELIVALILSSTISILVKYLTENKNKIKLNKALSEYVSKNVAREILS